MLRQAKHYCHDLHRQDAWRMAAKLRSLSWVDSVGATKSNTIVVTTKPLYVGKLCFGPREFRLCRDYPRILCPNYEDDLPHRVSSRTHRFCLGGFKEPYNNFMQSFDFVNAAFTLRCFSLSVDGCYASRMELLLRHFNGDRWFKLVSPDLDFVRNSHYSTSIESIIGNTIEIQVHNLILHTREFTSYTLQ